MLYKIFLVGKQQHILLLTSKLNNIMMKEGRDINVFLINGINMQN